MLDLMPYRDSTRAGVSARLAVANASHNVGEMRAARVLHLASQQPISLVGIRSTWRDDLYITILGAVGERKVQLQVILNPLVRWIWLGAGVITAGTLIAVFPELRWRRRPAPPTRAC